MNVTNVHVREFARSRDAVWEKLRLLSTKTDPVWPHENWPRMILYPNLSQGAKGGHGPIRYTVEEILEHKEIKFRFLKPKGFDGYHLLKLEGNDEASTLIHEIRMETNFVGSVVWLVVIKHLHDALIEDAFTKLEGSLQLSQKKMEWNLWVKMLRLILK
ncbi:MAG: hypothetical protein O9264_09755 [Leptospira sp.]|nr:hypothetical protein [Leptospira sp.]